MPPVVEVRSPNQWTAREFLTFLILLVLCFKLLFQYQTFFLKQIMKKNLLIIREYCNLCDALQFLKHFGVLDLPKDLWKIRWPDK